MMQRIFAPEERALQVWWIYHLHGFKKVMMWAFQHINLTSQLLILNQATLQLCLQASTNFRSLTAEDWLNTISESNAILSAILAVIHPNLYDVGWKTTQHLRKSPEIGCQNVLSWWASVFSSIAVISNCITQPHRDRSSRFNWYDILAMVGTYQNCTMKLPGLGISLGYSPGTRTLPSRTTCDLQHHSS